MARRRRLTGATRGIAYGTDPDVAVSIGAGATYFDNAYDVSVDFDIGDIETTAFGDYPFGTSEPGFIKPTISLSMRKQVGAADCEFIDDRALAREPFRVFIMDDRTATAPSGWDMAVVATKVTDSGDFQSAQDLSYTLALAPSDLAPFKR
jgi:hypothetical protein